jgi:hypothetical protein
MKLGYLPGAAVAFTLFAIVPAAAGVEFGAPDFPNYLSRPGLVSCDWQYESYFRACPEPQTPPKVVEAPGKTKGKGKAADKTK